MSVMRCDWCDKHIDTDFDVEGACEKDHPFRYKCRWCLERDNEMPDDDGYIIEGEK